MKKSKSITSPPKMRNVVVRDMIVRGGGTPINPNQKAYDRKRNNNHNEDYDCDGVDYYKDLYR